MKFHQEFIMADTENNVEGGKHLDYAWQNWCYHFSLVLIHERDTSHIESSFQDWLGTFMMKMQQRWLKLWFYKLGNFDTLRVVSNDCHLALERLVVSLLIME